MSDHDNSLRGRGNPRVPITLGGSVARNVKRRNPMRCTESPRVACFQSLQYETIRTFGANAGGYTPTF